MLPPVTELYRLYNAYNKQYFHFSLPPADEVVLEYSNRLTSSAGICYTKKNIIRFSTHYHLKFPQEINATLLHEMIHLIVPGHGQEFKWWLVNIQNQGGQVQLHSREKAAASCFKWLYTCVSCKKEFLRQRRLKNRGRHHLCGSCKGKIKEDKLTEEVR